MGERANLESERSAVIFDKHPLWLDAMRRLIASVGITAVGQTTDCDHAAALLKEHQVDLFIAGIDPLEPNQIACVRAARQGHPGLKSIVLADSTDSESIEAAFVAGATLYCAKTAIQEDLASAIRQLFDRSIYTSLEAGCFPTAPRGAEEWEHASANLTQRELEILRLAAEGSSNSQLAQMLWVTEQTVKFHLSNIYRKLNVTNRTEASRWAQVNGLLPLRPQEQSAQASVAAVGRLGA